MVIIPVPSLAISTWWRVFKTGCFYLGSLLWWILRSPVGTFIWSLPLLLALTIFEILSLWTIRLPYSPQPTYPPTQFLQLWYLSTFFPLRRLPLRPHTSCFPTVPVLHLALLSLFVGPFYVGLLAFELSSVVFSRAFNLLLQIIIAVLSFALRAFTLTLSPQDHNPRHRRLPRVRRVVPLPSFVARFPPTSKMRIKHIYTRRIHRQPSPTTASTILSRRAAMLQFVTTVLLAAVASASDVPSIIAAAPIPGNPIRRSR